MRTSDDQIANWREDWYQTHLSPTGKWVGSILDALEAERERADTAQRVVSAIRDVLEDPDHYPGSGVDQMRMIEQIVYV